MTLKNQKNLIFFCKHILKIKENKSCKVLVSNNCKTWHGQTIITFPEGHIYSHFHSYPTFHYYHLKISQLQILKQSWMFKFISVIRQCNNNCAPCFLRSLCEFGGDCFGLRYFSEGAYLPRKKYRGQNQSLTNLHNDRKMMKSQQVYFAECRKTWKFRWLITCPSYL